ncbi:autotransporter outer membrane beta-barrel domain-containing protein [Bordetella pseudohinzii]|nr:autotransporter outer membrane beta-barrel domain-containing protein [Bordetella pseudohinzii]
MPGLARAQTPIGPGTINTSQVLNGGNWVVQGNTTIDVPNVPSAGWGILARTGSVVALDSAAGPIQIIGHTAIGHALQVQNGSTLTNNGGSLSLTTSGAGEYGIDVYDLGQLTLSNVTINTSGGRHNTSVGAYGIWVGGAGALGNLSNSTINTTGGATGAVASAGNLNLTDVTVSVQNGGNSDYGVNAQSGGTIVMTRGSVTTDGTYGAALRASGSSAPGSLVQASNVTLRTSGLGGYGVLAVFDNARAEVSNADIATTGEQGYGYSARETGQITSSNSNVRTAGVNGYGAYVRSQANVTLTGGSITTTGASARGVSVADANTFLSTRGLALATSGSEAIGAYASAGATLSMDGGSIATSGPSAYGLFANAAGTTATATGLSISTTGSDSHALMVVNGATLNAASTQASATGDGASGLFFSTTAGNTSLATLSNGTLSSGAAPTIAVAGGDATLNMSGMRVSGSQNWLRVANDTAFAASGRRAPLTLGTQAAPAAVVGDATEAEPALPVVTVGVLASSLPGNLTLNADASEFTGAAVTDAGNTSNVTLNANSHWTLTGDSTLTTLALNNSAIDFQAPAAGAYKTLTVNNYSGSNGVIGLNTYLGADGSPSDRLVINGGAATGSTGLRITNTGGPGALTVADGIKVVDAQAGATSTANAFSLAHRAVAGPYEYGLYRGDQAGVDPESWYLRSQRADDPGEPLYRPEVGAYLANQHFAATMFQHSLHDRLGEPQFIERTAFGDQATRRRSAWLRMVGRWEQAGSRNDNISVRSDIFMLQGGGDLAQWQVGTEDGRLHLGVMGTYGRSNSTGRAGGGNKVHAHGKVDGYALGLYATWFQNDASRLGAYVDTWLQYGWFNNRVFGDDLPRVDYDSQGLSASAEAGYALALTQGWVLEPQAQVIYTSTDTDTIADDGTGTRVGAANTSGVTTRLGVRTHRSFDLDGGRQVQPYLTLNWWHMPGDDKISFNHVRVGDIYPTNAYEAKLGVNANFAKGWTGFVNVAGMFGENSYQQYSARIGVKYTW